jgi:hypothetical protein
MRLPNRSAAVVDIEKLSSYCLSLSHPRGRHKARVFAAALGLAAPDAPSLRAALLRAASRGESTPIEADEYGQRYLVDFDMTHAGRRARIRSAWIIIRGELAPRLTSCYVL